MAQLSLHHRFHLLAILLFGCLLLAHAEPVSYLEGIPTVPFSSSDTSRGSEAFPLRGARKIIVDQRYANVTDRDGSTLIPLTLLQFANTFAEDLQTIFNLSMVW